MRCFFIVLSCFLIAACGHVGGLNLWQYRDVGATPDNFTLCHGYGCHQKTRIGFNNYEWKTIQKIFKSKAKTAKSERQKIAKAIALMEKYAGEVARTADDLAKAPLLRQTKHELDCVDETVNTTKYIGFLENAGFLKFYKQGRPVYKGYFINGVYPHNSASIIESDTNQIYAVDSYIFKNGEVPDIRPLEDWLKRKYEDTL